MAANWRVNVLFGVCAFIFTYLFSIANNTWLTALVRAGFGFLIFFLLGYVMRIVIHQMAGRQQPNHDESQYSSIKSSQDTASDKPSAEEASFQSVTLGALHQETNMNEPNKIPQ